MIPLFFGHGIHTKSWTRFFKSLSVLKMNLAKTSAILNTSSYRQLFALPFDVIK